MKKTNLIIHLALLFALLCPWAAEAGASDREIIVGDSVPVVTLDAMEGKQHRIPAQDGLSVVLFWSTWSPRSAKAITLWQDLLSDYPDESFTVVSVAAQKDELGEEDIQEVNRYITENRVTLPVILDEKLELFNSYGIKALPTVFMLDGSGAVLTRYSGLPSSASVDLREELEARLGLSGPETRDERAALESPEYQPENNALPFFRMGKVFEDKGFFDKAADKYIEALQKDPKYEDPLRSLEKVYFREGRTPEAEGKLKALLMGNGLEELSSRVTEAGTPEEKTPDSKMVPPEDKPLTPMERMRLLMEKDSRQQ